MEKTEFRLNNLEKRVDKIDERQDNMDRLQGIMENRVKSTEAVTEKLSDLVDEIRINNVTLTNFVKKNEKDRHILYGAIVTAISSGLISLIVALM